MNQQKNKSPFLNAKSRLTQPGQIVRKIKQNIQISKIQHQDIQKSGKNKKLHQNDHSDQINTHLQNTHQFSREESQCTQKQQIQNRRTNSSSRKNSLNHTLEENSITKQEQSQSHNYNQSQQFCRNISSPLHTPKLKANQLLCGNNSQVQLQMDNLQQIQQYYQSHIQKYREQVAQYQRDIKTMKQTIQRERKFFMNQMYSKQLINQDYQYQIQSLKGQIQKIYKVQFQLNQKNRFLQGEICRLKTEKQMFRLDCTEDDNKMFAAEQDQIVGYNYRDDIQLNQQMLEERLVKSLDGFHVQKYRQYVQGNLAYKHEMQIQKYETQIKNLIDFYQHRIQSLRKFDYSPLKRPQIFIDQNYQIDSHNPDTLTTQSYRDYVYQNLKMSLNQNEAGNSGKRIKIGQCESQFTIQHFRYPTDSKKQFDGEQQDRYHVHDRQQYGISCGEIQTLKDLNNLRKKQSSNKKQRVMSQKELSMVYGFSLGAVASAIITCLVLKPFKHI